jgi:long-chain acyl-CoA synthetase
MAAEEMETTGETATETGTGRQTIRQVPLRKESVRRSAVDLFNERVRLSGPKTALRWREGGVWREATFSDWDRAAREIAAGLRALGVGRGDRVCLLANTRPEWVYTDVGILMAGAVTVPIYQSNLPHECEYIVNDAGAKVVFAEDPVQVEKLVAQRDKLGRVTQVVYFDGVSRLPKPDAKGRVEVTLESVVPEAARGWLLSLTALRERGRAWLAEAERKAELERSWADIDPESPFTIVYTSGTTGPPKGVVLLHRNLTWECDAIRAVLPLDENDEALAFLPLAHIFARLLEWYSILKGCRTAFAESVAKVRDNLAEVRPTFMCAVPRVLEKMYLAILGNRSSSPPTKQKIFDWAFAVGREHSHRAQRREHQPLALQLKYALANRLVFHKIQALLGGRMRFIISGGAPLSKEIAEFFHAAGVLILEGWGLTETLAGTAVNRLDKYAFGTVGAPIPGIEIKIADDGEILVRGGSVMKEYYNRPEATREVIDSEGWFHTGDIGQMVDGLLQITDRKKDIIVNAGGKNIAPQNLENALKATPYISQVMVYGDKKPYLVALITLNEENVTAWAREHNVPFSSLAELAKAEPVRRLVARAVDELNACQPSYSSIKKFVILPSDFSQESGELTPTLKVKRKFTYEKYKDLIEGLYATPGGGGGSA